jgi:hypothetical protein
LALLSASGLTGCDAIDPLNRPYAWAPTNSTRHNVALMAANPADLIHGRDEPRRNARAETDAIDRVWTNHPTGLLNSGSGGGAAPAGGGG